MTKKSNYVKINIVNPLHLIISKANEYFEEINRNKYLTIVLTNEIKKIIKKYDGLKIRDLITSGTKNR